MPIHPQMTRKTKFRWVCLDVKFKVLSRCAEVCFRLFEWFDRHAGEAWSAQIRLERYGKPFWRMCWPGSNKELVAPSGEILETKGLAAGDMMEPPGAKPIA